VFDFLRGKNASCSARAFGPWEAHGERSATLGVAMMVNSCDGEARVRSQKDLVRRLKSNRKGDYGAFILSHGKVGPSLWIHIRKELACLHYFPDPDYLIHAGYHPTGMTPAGCKRKVRFRVLPSRIEDFGGAYFTESPESLVSLSDAVIAAKEFFKDARLPASIQWLEL
jgi:hypothetical protein